MDAVIALYTPQLTPRFKWAAKVFLKNAMRLEMVIYTSEEAFAKAKERGEAAFVTFVTAGFPDKDGE